MGKHADPNSPRLEPFKPSGKPTPDTDGKPGGAHAKPKDGTK